MCNAEIGLLQQLQGGNKASRDTHFCSSFHNKTTAAVAAAKICPNFTDGGWCGGSIYRGVGGGGSVMVIIHKSHPPDNSCTAITALSVEREKGDEEEEEEEVVGCHSVPPSPFLRRLRLLCGARSRHPPPPTGRIWPQRNPVTSRPRQLPWLRE